MRPNKYEQKKKKRKKRFQTFLSFAILLGIFIGGVTGYYGSKVGSFLDGISADDDGTEDFESVEITQQLEDLEPFSALVLGVDVEDRRS